MKLLQLKRWRWPLVLALLVAVVLSGTYTMAKYISVNSEQEVITPADFYFESDLLSLEGATYTINGDTIAFELYNYADSLRTSTADIAYTVTVTGQANKTGTITVAGKKASVTYSGLSAGTYTVTAKSTSPFEKTLTATFTLVQTPGFTSTYTNDSNVVYLYITTNDSFSGTLNVSWPENLVPDNTNPTVSDVAATSLRIVARPNSKYTLVFFKTDSSVTYDADPFTVTEQ